MGSLNASLNAFDNNVEFLLELQYKNYHSSYWSVRDDFIPNEESPFVSMTDINEEFIEPEDAVVDFRLEVYGVIGAKVFEKMVILILKYMQIMITKELQLDHFM